MSNSFSNRFHSLAQFTAWLLFAGIAGALTFMVWVASAVKPTPKANLQDKATTVLDPNILLVNHNPDEMHRLVHPITFDAIVRDKRNYPKEFKDSRFIKTNLNRWTVQVMNVEQHEVVTTYLASREDRDKFNYFRIIDENNQKRFILTYGVYNSAQEAMGASKMIQFQLPNNVETFPEEFKLYLSQMDEYEISPTFQDVSKSAPKDVKLSPTRREIPAPKAQETRPEIPKPKESIENSTNKNETLAIEEKHTVPAPMNPIYADPYQQPVQEKPKTPKETRPTTPPPAYDPTADSGNKNVVDSEPRQTQSQRPEKPTPKRNVENNNHNSNSNTNSNTNSEPDLPIPVPTGQ